MVEVQDIFKELGQEYLEKYRPPPHVCKTVRAITNCRTSELGSHVDICNDCGYTHVSYNSCRNRHCPKCQALSKEQWIMARQNELLPVTYFHVVFSLPKEFDSFVMKHPKEMYNLLFKASKETIMELAMDKKYLGAKIGLTSILHTWGQNLTLHPHVHMIVPGGGLTDDDKWLNSKEKFFIPVKVMSKKFRGKFLYYFKQKYEKEALQLRNVISNLYEKNWYVYCKRPFKTTNSVLEYLGRYTHRVAISNHRIMSFKNSQLPSQGLVSFKWRDYKAPKGKQEKVMTISATEFVRRFLLHILPPQFTKIRHYGFLASAVKKKKLSLCKKLTGAKLSPPQEKLSTVELIKKLTGKDITLCPICGNKLARASPFDEIA